MSTFKQVIISHAGKVTKYLLIGVLATAVYLGGVYLITEAVHTHPAISAALSFIVSTTLAYFGHKYITFRNFAKEHKRQFASFVIFAILGIIVNVGIVYLFEEVFQIWYMFGAATGSGTAFVMNYFLNNFITFKETPRAHITLR